MQIKSTSTAAMCHMDPSYKVNFQCKYTLLSFPAFWLAANFFNQSERVKQGKRNFMWEIFFIESTPFLEKPNSLVTPPP